jgi:hypothetical protein
MEPLIINGRQIQLKYKSPLVVEQSSQDVKTFLTYYQCLQGIVGEEEAKMYIKPAKLPIWLANKFHVDPSLINSEEEMEQLLEQKANEMNELENLNMEAAQNGIEQQPGQPT